MSEELYFQLYPWLHLIGRVLFSVAFVVVGLNRLVKLNDMAGYAQSKGIPAPKAATALAGLLVIIGGLLVLLGWHRFIGAGLLAILLLLTAFLMHAFWKEADPMVRSGEMAHFLKDLSLAGAALIIAAYGGTSWPYSLGG